MTPGRIEIRVLGGLEISVNGEPVELPRAKKGRLLLAYLILRCGRPAERAHIAALLWPESYDEVARFNLRQLLRGVRKDLGELGARMVASDATELAFHASDCWIDLVEFRKSLGVNPHGAVELYRGPLLDGLQADWLQDERVRTDMAFREALIALTESSPSKPHQNLPEPLTSFVGREREIAQVKTLLKQTRLLTFTGSGGCGKTRLALRVAAEVVGGYSDGVCMVELASVLDPLLVPQMVGAALGLKEESEEPISTTVLRHLKVRRLVLVMDNCEHLLPACCNLVSDILKHCPLVTVLATSREALSIGGEQAYRVPSLSLPHPAKVASVAALCQYEATRLFIERAKLAKPDFTLTEDSAAALAHVCARLDGIPLAIELASARVRSLRVQDISSRLDHLFQLLIGGDRSVLPRHQTLRSLIDWSYDLLTDSEKALLRRLSVFAGGWTIESADGVCSGNGIPETEILNNLTSLADKSLVVVEGTEGGTRFRLLESVGQYARDCNRQSGEDELWRDRHLAYFTSVAERAEPLLASGEQIWHDRFEAER